jgi:hypothetical protein
MGAYELTICIHVVTAIVGVGQVTGLVLVAATSRKSLPVAPATWTALKRLARGTSWSLLLMLLTGLILEFLAGGVHGHSWWFRIAVLLFLGCGAVLGMIQRALKKGEAAGDGAVLAAVVTRGWIVVGLVAVIAGLMQLKPW